MNTPALPYRSLSFVTCLHDEERYERCRRSLAALDPAGFAVEILPIENRENRLNAAAALNQGWSQARGELLVFCHEDVEFPPDWLLRLREGLAALEAQLGGPRWGLVGPIGRVGKTFAGAYSDGRESFRYEPLPARVQTLDELCLVAHRALPWRFDEALGGFHLYGVDLALECWAGGLEVWALELFLHHHSRTVPGISRPPEYHAIKRRLQRKWRWPWKRRGVGRKVGTTSGQIRLGILRGWV